MMLTKRCFIIAEAGVNHDGSLDKAIQLVDAAAASGADAVKFQTFSADRLVTLAVDKADYQKRATVADESQYAMLKRLELPNEAHVILKTHAEALGIEFLSTPFDEVAADFLDDLGVRLFKIPSGELTNLPYLRHVASKGRPLIISTGMATLGEVERALEVVGGAGAQDVTVLHCTSNYPAAMPDVNLRAMMTMRDALGVKVGYSDHTLGTEVSVAAVALGASVIEKHFTINAKDPGPDHAASLEPPDLRLLVRSIRNVEEALGNGVKRPARSEAAIARVARKTIVCSRDLQPGEVLSENDLVMRRAGRGLGAEWLPMLVGRCVRLSLAAGTAVELDAIR